jgi:transposase
MIYLAGRCHDSRRTVVEIVKDLFGVPVSLGTVSNYEAEMGDALADSHRQALSIVQNARVKNVDETGWKQAGKLRWLWTAATRTVAAFGIFAGRTIGSFHEMLGEKVKGIIQSDRLPTYNQMPPERRGICWSHISRDFQKWLDLGGATKLLGEDGKKICRGVFKLWRNFREGQFNRKSLQRRIKRLRKRMVQILRWGLRCGDRKAVQFCRNVLAVEEALWTFARVPGVEPTNNHAERMLRRAVLWRKNCFGSHSQRGCRFAERILTIVQTLRLQNRNVLRFIQDTIASTRSHNPLPTLVL